MLLTTLVGQRVMYDLRMEIFGHLQRLSVTYFDRNPVGRLMTRVTSDVETLNELFSSGVVTIFGDVFTLVAIMAMMLVIDVKLALVTFAVIPLVWLTAAIFRRRVRDAFRDIRYRLARLNAFLQERLSGMRVVQLFGREEASAERFAELNREHLAAHLRSITIYAIFFPVVEVLTAVAMALLLWYGGLRVLDETLTVGVLAAFIQYTRRFFQPLQDLSEKFNLLQSAMASSERVFALLDEPVTVPEPASPRPLPRPLRGEVRFEGVWFRYSPDGPWVLRDVSFVASPGKTVALVGTHRGGEDHRGEPPAPVLRPGAGPDHGGWRGHPRALDRGPPLGHRLRAAGSLPVHRRHPAQPDPRARRSRPRPRGARRRGWARTGSSSGCRPGTATGSGERGRNLSVGERQLLSFARALALDPRILVLDEATSSVDAEAEAQIQRAIAELMAGRTSLVVAHRLSTILHADEILVMHHGEIRERGTHRELLAAGGLYERLYQLQLRGQEARKIA